QNTGTWKAVQVAPLSGDFHGSFVSASDGSELDVTGNMTQAQNTGGSNATLTGTMTADGSAHFCSYVSTATINGLISGTTATIGLFGPKGSQFSKTSTTVPPDGPPLPGPFVLPALSPACPPYQGTLTLSFP